MDTETTSSALSGISREDLYQRVWATPINHLADELGMNHYHLARICEALNVPRPPAGYWQKKAVGKEAPRPDLPAALPGDQVRWVRGTRPSAPPTKRVYRRMERKAADRPQRPTRHPMLIGVEESFRKSRTDEQNEFLRPYKYLLPDIVASADRLAAALDVANEIYNALDLKGHRVMFAPSDQEMRRIHVDEQEVSRKDRKYGRYQTGSIWSPRRPTVTYVGSIPVGLALTEMTERVTMRYLDGSYVREDSKLVRSARPWQLTHSWTTEQDLPCGRFRFVAYSPLANIDWSASWQDTQSADLKSLVPSIVSQLQSSEAELQTLIVAEEKAAAQRRKEWAEAQERYRRQEDRRAVERALADSKEQLAEIMEKWAAATAVERFFEEAEQRLERVDDERRAQIQARLALARAMLGEHDPLQFLSDWLAPQERYQSKYPLI
ncbi:MAG TPA: hypothetical protein VGN82_12270 [Bosea sp. (in: a-proteobacteria)]|jgi:hypothetical protein|uniref:hypothetical protein n=1 Tax=Bosea sp. (in: a-proteobacteria) TaxID=1871050 RepID=UPI002E0E0860|nr:hypothetical protein [Bosea sp. (in: a-proteobacteria)]